MPAEWLGGIRSSSPRDIGGQESSAPRSGRLLTVVAGRRSRFRTLLPESHPRRAAAASRPLHCPVFRDRRRRAIRGGLSIRRVRNNRVKVQAAVPHFGGGADRHLAASAQLVQQARVRRSWRRGQPRHPGRQGACSVPESPARISIPSAPWPAAGHISLAGITCFTSSVLPRRFRPAAARMIASYSPASSLRSRVSTFPRKRMNVEIGPQRLQLRLPPQAAGAHARSLRQIFNAGVLAASRKHPRILALGDGGDLKSRRKFGGQIFQAVHREIDAAFGQRFFNFLGEHALGADLGQGDIGESCRRWS